MKTRICVEAHDGTLRKLAVLSANAAGLYLSAPYHSAGRGFFVKVRPTDQFGIQHLEIVDGPPRITSSVAKLSIHPAKPPDRDSTFIHFSGPGIRSGIDLETGQLKGMGILGPPLETIQTGPTFAASFWGLQDFEQLDAVNSRTMIFNRTEIIAGMLGNSQSNGIAIEFFFFSNSARQMRSPTFKKGFWFEKLWRLFSLRVIELPALNSFVGVLCRFANTEFRAPSGFSMVTPRFNGDALMAMYPQPKLEGNEISLDF